MNTRVVLVLRGVIGLALVGSVGVQVLLGFQLWLDRGGAAEIDEQLRGLRVLVVDDDLGIRTSLKEVLEGWGCTIDVAEDGAMRRAVGLLAGDQQ